MTDYTDMIKAKNTRRNGMKKSNPWKIITVIMAVLTAVLIAAIPPSLAENQLGTQKEQS